MSDRVVVIGGGVMGTSAAFHLAEAGARVLLLEREELACGSTSKAAGGVRANFTDPVNIALGKRSLAAFEDFGRRPGAEIDLRQHGYLFLLTKSEDVAAFERATELQNSLGVASRMLEPAEAGRLCPYARTDDLLAAAYSPRDGHCTPEAVVQGYAAGARRFGAEIRRDTRVTGIERCGGAVSGVWLGDELLSCSAVICTAGAWSSELAATAEVELPVRALRRQILVTEPLTGMPAELPFTIDFDSLCYFHPEGPGLLMGAPDPEPRYGMPVVGGEEEWLEAIGEAIAWRAPELAELGVAHRWSGYYELSPDSNGMIGEAIPGFYYATGFSGHGFLQGPAVGEVLRDLVLDQEPVIDVSTLDARRFAEERGQPEGNCV